MLRWRPAILLSVFRFTCSFFLCFSCSPPDHVKIVKTPSWFIYRGFACIPSHVPQWWFWVVRHTPAACQPAGSGAGSPLWVTCRLCFHFHPLTFPASKCLEHQMACSLFVSVITYALENSRSRGLPSGLTPISALPVFPSSLVLQDGLCHILFS